MGPEGTTARSTSQGVQGGQLSVVLEVFPRLQGPVEKMKFPISISCLFELG